MAASISNKPIQHLFLHFDINGTIVGDDTNNDNKQHHDVVSSCIAEKYKAIWDESFSHPMSYFDYVKQHLCPTRPTIEIDPLNYEDYWDETLSSPMTFYDYVKQRLCPLDLSKDVDPTIGNDLLVYIDSLENANALMDRNQKSALITKLKFKIKTRQKILLSNTLTEFKKRKFAHLDAAEKDYDSAIEALRTQKTKVFPSFFKLIKYLNRKQQPFTLLLRTFGPDAGKVNDVFKARRLGCVIQEENFHRVLEGVFKIQDENGNMKETNLHEYIMGFRAKPGQHLAIRDHHQWWFDHGEQDRYGKAFPVDLTDRSHLSIAFDDHTNILRTYNAKTNDSIPTKELIEKKRVFVADTLAAICDKMYYVNLFKEARRAFKTQLTT